MLLEGDSFINEVNLSISRYLKRYKVIEFATSLNALPYTVTYMWVIFNQGNGDDQDFFTDLKDTAFRARQF
jgi:hypothetical protein